MRRVPVRIRPEEGWRRLRSLLDKLAFVIDNFDELSSERVESELVSLRRAFADTLSLFEEIEDTNPSAKIRPYKKQLQKIFASLQHAETGEGLKAVERELELLIPEDSSLPPSTRYGS